MELSHHLTTLFDELMQPSALFSHTAKTMFPITEELRGNDLYISAELPGMKIEANIDVMKEDLENLLELCILEM